jgi:phospholipid/cholesterol/gamma-HCH transport system ATP-binding protein
MSPVAAHVRLVRIEKAFGAKRVLVGADLEVHPGELVTLLGASGSGKSVLLKLMIRLMEVDAGRIEINGVDVAHLSERELLPFRRRVAMLFQSSALFDSISVGSNVAYPLRLAGTFSAAEIRGRVANRLELVGLPGIEEMRPSDLSGGMRKRVALARAIAGDPELLLFDEPTMGLDPISRRRINDLIDSVRHRLAVTSVVVTHDLATAYSLSDHIAMISRGRILKPLRPREFFESEEPTIHAFISAMPGFRPEAIP